MSKVSKLWVFNFVKHQPELHTYFSCKYDYQRAKCEDSKVISDWFISVQNMKAMYHILDDDLYNFDEIGFMIDMIFTSIVVTTLDDCNKAKLTQLGNQK